MAAAGDDGDTAAGVDGDTESAQEGLKVVHAAKPCRAAFSRRPGGRKCIVALDRCVRFLELGRIRGSIPEGIMNWDGLLFASIVSLLPLGVRDNFVQEATVAEHELEQEVRSLVLYTDGSASMSGGWPKEPALASWSVIVLTQCHSRLIPLFACAAPVDLDPAGPSLSIWVRVEEQTTLERFQRSLWRFWSFTCCAVFQGVRDCQRF